MSKSTELTKVETGPSGVTSYDPEIAALYGAGKNDGMENVGREDTALPFLKILQGLSPEVQRGTDKYIKGAEQGQFINSLTGERWDGETGIRVIRVYFEKKYFEWRPKKGGGGLVRISSTLEEAKQHKQPDVGNPDTDTVIDETAQIYCLVEGKFGWMPVLFSASRTKWPFVRKWNGVAMSLKAGEFEGDPIASKLPPDATIKPLSVIFKLTTATKTNDSGTFFVPQLAKEKSLAPRDVLKLAIEFYEAVRTGAVKVEYKEPVEDAQVEDVPGIADAAV